LKTIDDRFPSQTHRLKRRIDTATRRLRSFEGEDDMFEILVESAKSKQRRRSGRFFVMTGLAYAAMIAAFGVAAIIGFRPALAESYDLIAKLTPPVIPGPIVRGTRAPRQTRMKPAPPQGFVVPEKIEKVRPFDELKDLDLGRKGPRLADPAGTDWSNLGGGGGVPGGASGGGDDPPPPPRQPKEETKSENPTEQRVVRLTSQITQGSAIRKVQPPYPSIARMSKIQGSVQVQINISETGAVTDAVVLSGSPFLRDAAVQAARQWVFKPTELNGKPVRAIGVITFNFLLN
jgi:protein TonB